MLHRITIFYLLHERTFFYIIIYLQLPLKWLTMRLSQLARKLEISPTELISFFKKNKIGKYNSHNNKVEETDLKLALNHFSPVETNSEGDKKVRSEIVSKIDIPEEKEEDNNPPSASQFLCASNIAESWPYVYHCGTPHHWRKIPLPVHLSVS